MDKKPQQHNIKFVNVGTLKREKLPWKIFFCHGLKNIRHMAKLNLELLNTFTFKVVDSKFQIIATITHTFQSSGIDYYDHWFSL